VLARIRKGKAEDSEKRREGGDEKPGKGGLMGKCGP